MPTERGGWERRASSTASLQAAARSEFPTRDQAILLLLLTTGIRIGELAQLAWQDIHFGETPGQIWLRVRTSARVRRIPLSTQMYQALVRYRVALPKVDPTLQPFEETGITSSSDQPRGPLWQRQDEDGRPLSQRVLSQIIVALAQETRMIVPPGRAWRQVRSTFIHEYLTGNPESFDGLALGEEAPQWQA